MFRLHRHPDKEITGAADITIDTGNRSECLHACFELAPCEVAVFKDNEAKCQLFTTRLNFDNNLTDKSNSDVYHRTCEGAF